MSFKTGDRVVITQNAYLGHLHADNYDVVIAFKDSTGEIISLEEFRDGYLNGAIVCCREIPLERIEARVLRGEEYPLKFLTVQEQPVTIVNESYCAVGAICTLDDRFIKAA